MLTFRGGVGYGVFGLVTWQVAVYVASVAALALSVAFCGLVLTPESWLGRWSWARHPESELLLWAALAFIAGLLITAGGFIAGWIDALNRDNPLG